jgi:hypothetical protein
VMDPRSGRNVTVTHAASSVWIEPGSDLEAFLAAPLVAHVATTGPSVRAVWFLWEDGAFWWLTGAWSRLSSVLKADPRVVLLVDSRDFATGAGLELCAEGDAEIYQLDTARACRVLRRYLGPDVSRWPECFQESTFHDPATRLIRLEPSLLRARTLSYDAVGGDEPVA